MRAPVVALATTVLLTACSGTPGPAERPAEGDQRAASAAVRCPDSQAALAFPADADLRYAPYAGGSDHGNVLRDAADRYGETHDLDIGMLGASFYSSPVPFDLTARLTGDPPADVVTAFVGGVLRSCAERGLLRPLDEVWDRRGWSAALPPAVTDLATVAGHRYWVPTTVQWNPVFYRTDLFDRLGLRPPTDWQDLLRLCDRLRDDGRAAFTSAGAWSPPTARYFSVLDLRLNGAEFHQEVLAGRRSWLDPRIAAVFDHWRQLLDHGCFTDDAAGNDFAEAVDELASGKAAMWLIGEWVYEFADPSLRRRLDFVRFPTLDPSVPDAEIALVQGSVVNAHATDPEAAVGLAEHLGSAATLRRGYRTLGRVAVDPRVDLPYDAVHRRADAYLRRTDSLVGLLEFSAEPSYASAMLSTFVEFLRAPESLDTLLEALEGERLATFPDARGAQ